MTVWKIVRVIYTILSVPLMIVVGLNIERIAQAHGWDKIVPDPGQASPLAALTHQPWLVFLSVLVVGTVVGIWADSIFGRILRRGVPTRRARVQSIGRRMKEMAIDIHHLHNLTLSSMQPLRQRLINSDLNILFTDTVKLGIPIPSESISGDQLQDYLTAVGGRLAVGDELAAAREAQRFPS